MRPSRLNHFAIDQRIHAHVIAHDREAVFLQKTLQVVGIEWRFERAETLHHFDQFLFAR
jgi:hypothetical protein